LSEYPSAFRSGFYSEHIIGEAVLDFAVVIEPDFLKTNPFARVFVSYPLITDDFVFNPESAADVVNALYSATSGNFKS
jgi:hypothetical protein